MVIPLFGNVWGEILDVTQCGRALDHKCEKWECKMKAAYFVIKTNQIITLNLCSKCAKSLTINVSVYCVYGSVHRWSILIIVQRAATQSSLFNILQVHCTCFGCQPHPSSRVHKTVTTASGTCRIFCAAASLQHGQVRTGVVGCGWRPKHAEWTCRIINRLLCVVLFGQLLIYNKRVCFSAKDIQTQ